MIRPLDQDQQACVDSIDGVYIVLAGPGSGKTTVMVSRYLNLLVHGVSEKDILSLTFTAEAAEEMASRSGVSNAKDVFRTFHSFALNFLHQERKNLSFELKDSILPFEGEDRNLLLQLVRENPGIGRLENLREYISTQKRAARSPEEAAEFSFGFDMVCAEAYAEYEKRCRKEGWLDFDSLMVETVRLLETNEEVRSRYKRKYIQVDEAQDTDVIQFRLLQLLFDGNIFAVGDENQLIYEWRSAQAGNLTKFSQYFPGAKTLYLGRNYRSTGAIVEFLKEITPVDNGLASFMRTDNEYGLKPTFVKYLDDYEEANQVLSRVTDPTITAIIARTNRQLFRFQQICFTRGIKHKILGKKAFWELDEVKHLLRTAKKEPVIPGQTAAMVLKKIVVRENLLSKYKWSGNPLDSDPIDNINCVYKLATKYNTVDEFLNFIRKLTYGSKSSKTPALTLSTVHQAKGREWPHVFVVGMTEGILPHNKSNWIEEQRIWFVAASRAAKRLDVTCYRNPSMFLNAYRDRIVEFKPEGSSGILIPQQQG